MTTAKLVCQQLLSLLQKCYFVSWSTFLLVYSARVNLYP